MKRTNILITEEQYEKLSSLRHTEGHSIAYFIRVAIQAQWLGDKPQHVDDPTLGGGSKFRKTACKKHKTFTCGCKE